MSGWRRIKVPAMFARVSENTRAWQKDVADGYLEAFASPDEEGFHLSICHKTMTNRPGRYPTWDEIYDARYRFAPLDKTMAMLLPPQDEYVNIHATTFHLWELREGE